VSQQLLAKSATGRQENAGPAPPVSASHMEIGRPAAASALDSGLPTARTYLAIMIS